MANHNKTIWKSRSYHTAANCALPRAWAGATDSGIPRSISSIVMEPEENTIVIVEDDPTVRQALGDILSMLGYRTDLFASAEEFLLAGPTIEPTCLILDIQLGDITGVELARQLAAEGLTVPVIFMTGSNDPTFRRQALDFGCVAYLQKPFPAYQLIEAVKAATGGGPSLRSS